MTAILSPIKRSNSPRIHIMADDGGAFPIAIPERALTLTGFREWIGDDDFPENVRTTFVGGEIYLDMRKEEITTHAEIKAEIGRVLLELVRQDGRGRLYLYGVLVTNEAAGVSNNPDAVYLSLEGLTACRFRLVPGKGGSGRYAEIEGTPDWILEIVSAGSVRKDTVQLRDAYFRAGIPEYWLIDALGEQIVFQILRAGNGYEPVPVEDGWQHSTTFGRAFRLDRQQDAFGWLYSLQIK